VVEGWEGGELEGENKRGGGGGGWGGGYVDFTPPPQQTRQPGAEKVGAL
jgi:hypothetical protein